MKVIKGLINGIETELKLEIGDNPISIEVSIGSRVFLKTGVDYFEVLKELRRELEEYDVFLGCKGSCLNVYPSRMTSQMSNGLLAYELVMAKSTSDDDIINIFDPAELEDISTVEEQEEFHRNWIKHFTG